jgi:hypothetical protein
MLKGYKLIRISRKNAEILDNAGKKNETYDSILSKIFAQNKIQCVVTEEED